MLLPRKILVSVLKVTGRAWCLVMIGVRPDLKPIMKKILVFRNVYEKLNEEISKCRIKIVSGNSVEKIYCTKIDEL